MFGRKRPPVAVHEPAIELAPFQVTNPYPDRWVHVPRDFPTPQDRNGWDWTRREAGLRQWVRHPDGTTSGVAMFTGMLAQTRQRYPGHTSVWALLPQPLNGIEYLSLLFDLLDASAGSAGEIVQRLVAGSDDRLEVHPPGYQERPAAAALVLPAEAAGLGSGTCVIRQDLRRNVGRGVQQLLDEQDPHNYEDPGYWDLAVSVHWVFSTAARDVTAAVRTRDPSGLYQAMPDIVGLLDAVSISGQPAGPVDSGLRRQLIDAIGRIAADERA